jgi:membrane protein implicated in regulation of membrane protease activity
VGHAPAVIYAVFALWFGLAAGVVGRIKGSSFLVWFLIGLVLPVLGLLAAVFYRSERDEVRRQCPGCGKIVKLHDAMCMRCGTDLEFPEVGIESETAALGRR